MTSEAKAIAGKGFNNGIVVKEGHLSARVLKVLRNMKNEGYNVDLLINNCIDNLKSESLRMEIFYNEDAYELTNKDVSRKGTLCNINYMLRGLESIKNVLDANPGLLA